MRVTTVAICFVCVLTMIGGVSWGEENEIASDPATLEKTLKAAFDAAPNDDASMTAYIRYLNRFDRASEASVILGRLEARSDGLIALLRAETSWARGDSDSARSEIKTIANTDRARWIAGQELEAEMDYLEGQSAACTATCQRLLEAEPLNKNGRLYLIQLAMRYGKYDEGLQMLKTAETVWPDDIRILECRAEILDAQGKEAEAKQLRTSFLEKINASPPTTIRGLLAAAAAMRNLHAPRAALQCLELAQAHAPGDPFAMLEKIRLFRMTSQSSIAAATAQQLTARARKCGLAYYELAESAWAMKYDATKVEPLYLKALAADPELLAARCCLIRYALIASDSKRATELLAANERTNPNDLDTKNLKQAVEILAASSPPPAPGAISGRLAATLGELYAARRDVRASRDWFQLALTEDKENGNYLKGAGFASLQCGDTETALKLLEAAFAADRYDIAVKNTLDFLDDYLRSRVLTDGRVTVGYQRQDVGTAQYALFLAQQYLDEVERRFRVPGTEPLRIQLCTKKGDLTVLALGIPACTSCGGPAGPDGSLCLGGSVFVLAPEAVNGKEQSFRFDEALYRGITESILRRQAGSKAPLWMVDGMSRYAGMQHNPEWLPYRTGLIIEQLRGGVVFPLRELGNILLGELSLPARPYSALVFDVWREQYGEDQLLRLFNIMREGKGWIEATESVLGKPLAEIDKATVAAILKRYEGIKLDPAAPGGNPTLMVADNLSKEALVQRSALFVKASRYDDALKDLKPLIEEEAPPAGALLVAGRAYLAKGDAATARKCIEKGLALDQALDTGVATAKDYGVLGAALKMSGEQNAAIEAFQKGVALNPLDDAEQSPCGQLLELLAAKNPKPQAYYDALVGRMPVRRADASARLELAQWFEERGDTAHALAWYRSAAGLRPAWADVHEALAPLALREGAAEEAYRSYRALLVARPKDTRVLEALNVCAKGLHREKDTETFVAQVTQNVSESLAQH